MTMRRMSRAAVWGSLVLCAGCASEPPYVPGERVTFMALGSGGYRQVHHDRFVDDSSIYAVELISGVPGTGGWGYEVGGRFGSGDGDGTSRGVGGVLVTSERETDYYELDVGIRQTFRQEDLWRPYFGAGFGWVKAENTHRQPDLVNGGTEKHDFNDHGPIAYMRGGLLLVLGDQPVLRDPHVATGIDLRGVLGDDDSFLELSVVFGFGR